MSGVPAETRERLIDKEAEFTARIIEHRLEHRRRQDAEAGYEKAARETLKRIWNLCGHGRSTAPSFFHPFGRYRFKTSWGNHDYHNIQFQNAWKDVCRHCEMPKDVKDREKAVDLFTRELMKADVDAGLISDEDMPR